MQPQSHRRARQAFHPWHSEGWRSSTGASTSKRTSSLEEAWNQDSSAGRELYRAILQVAVAYLQIERKNYRGAMKMLLRVRQWIEPLPDRCRGVDVAALRADVERVHAELLKTGMQSIQDFDRRLMKPVNFEI